MIVCETCGEEREPGDFWLVGRYHKPDKTCRFCRRDQARERRRARGQAPSAIVTNDVAARFLRLPRFRLYHLGAPESAPMVVTTTARQST